MGTTSSQRQSEILFQAHFLIKEYPGIYHPFRNKEAALIKWNELETKHCILFKKIGTINNGQEDFIMPDRDNRFYLNAFSDPFSLVLECSTMTKLREGLNEFQEMGIDYASLYEEIAIVQ